MAEPPKPPVRKRMIVGWRQLEQRRVEIRAKHRPPPVPAKTLA